MSPDIPNASLSTLKSFISELHWAADSDCWRILWLSATNMLMVLCTRPKMVGDCVFGVATACIWNNFPPVVVMPSFLVFKKHLHN